MVGRFGKGSIHGLLFVLLASCGALSKCNRSDVLSAAQFEAVYASPLPPPEGPLKVFHLGHSLVGRDIPAMLQQLADEGHSYDSQLGWGTPLRAHWDPDLPINGFEAENAHDRYRDATEALTSGDYDTLVVTEMVEIRDAIKYHQSFEYLDRWATLARQGNPNTRVYLYETWPRIDDPEGWLQRLDLDLDRYWEKEILRPALALNEAQTPLYVIPAGQVFAEFIRAVEVAGSVDNRAQIEGLFTKDATGAPDPIHLNDLGTYLVALTHYAVLYQENPVGLPHELLKADGSQAVSPGEKTARLMQEIVWHVVTSYPKTGVAQTSAR